MGERGRDRNAENLLLPRASDHLVITGNGGRLSQIISTQLEVSRAEQLREMANKAELRALQSKINPHFLFNALNAISSSIRLNPDTARQLIFNLSRYLRYNIELKDDEQIDIKKELYQIKDYIAIEQARFGDKLTVIYDIDEEVNCCIPSLLIPAVGGERHCPRYSALQR